MLRSRFVMFTASSIWIALLLVVLVFRGGGAVPVEPRPEPARLPSVLNPTVQAAELVELGDYEGAWQFYQEALASAPEDVSLWYALGVTLSHLSRRQETTDAFRYVVDRGRPESEEVRVAREWLISAGVLARPVVFTSAPAAEAAEAKAAVKGKVTWGEPERGGAPFKARLLLHGVAGAAEGKRFGKRVTLGQVYRFEQLPAGSYRLIGSVEGQRLWDLTLDVEEGKEVILDLSRDNSSTPTAVALSQ